jgi:putative serine/threonine protein kinase
LTSSPQQRASFSAFEIGAPEFVKILTYPAFDEQVYKARLQELRLLGVTSILAGGRTTIGGFRIAGKGNVGLVVKARAGGRACALKIRRTDANRSSMEGEVRLHRIANGAGVGPALLKHSDNFMLMEFAPGKNIAEWSPGDPKNACRVARSVLEQCYRLDRAGIDHGELSHLDNHVIVDGDRATIIDFESASTDRKMSNVSAAGQSLFVAGAVAGILARMLGIDREQAIGALKKYKRNQTPENFGALLALLGV